MRNKKYAIWLLLMAESPQFLNPKANLVRDYDGDVRCLTESRNVFHIKPHSHSRPYSVIVKGSAIRPTFH